MNTPMFDTLESRTLFSGGPIDTGSATLTAPPFSLDVQAEHSSETDSSGGATSSRQPLQQVRSDRRTIELL